MNSYKNEAIPEFVVPDKRPVGKPRKEEPKRKRGRPRKGEEVAPKKMVVHNRPQINPENRVKYAKDTVRNAERIYMQYKKPFPNPLNIDEKDLLPEARKAWKYIFSLRDPSDYYNKDGSHTITRKAIHSGDELLYLFEAFCSYIRNKNFMKTFTTPDGEVKMMPIVPNQSNFATWLGIRRPDISKVIFESPAEIGVQYKAMLADLLSEGAMVGAYASTSTIFSLKNLCDWAEKYEDRSRPDTKTTVEEAERIMKELGISRPILEGKNG